MAFAVQRFLHLPADSAPVLTAVIDTEEEFDWAGGFDPARRSVSNIARQAAAQAIFERFGVVPAYVVDHPVAADPEAAAILARFLDTGVCEIGAHLHPWVNPPADEDAVPRELSFPGNLPPGLEEAKLTALTDAIGRAFGRRPTIYKAGRYGIGPQTARILARLKYRIDVSVVPRTDFSPIGGPDFSAYSDQPFETPEGIIALPLSAGFAGLLAGVGGKLFGALHSSPGRAIRLGAMFSRLGLLERIRLSPEGHSLAEMKRLVRAGLARGQRLFMLTYHSSSLLPGAAPYVGSDLELEDFLDRLRGLLTFFLHEVGGTAESVSAAAARLRPVSAAQ